MVSKSTEDESGVEMKLVSERKQECVEKSQKPFPWLAMNVLCLGMLAHSIVFTSPMPFVAFMVVDFKMSPDLDSAGYWAGWLTGVFMIGRMSSGLFWGSVSDRWGRKPCLLISMLSITFLGLLFGFSTNFTMAILTRLLLGLTNSYSGIARVCVSEVVHCKEHELKAYGIINGIWGLGLIVGPAIGGILARPAIQYPSLFSSSGLWGRFPYLLPCAVSSVMASICCVLLLLYFPETLVVTKMAHTSSSDGQEYEPISNASVHDDDDEKRLASIDLEDGKATATIREIMSGWSDLSDDDSNNEEEALSGGEKDNATARTASTEVSYDNLQKLLDEESDGEQDDGQDDHAAFQPKTLVASKRITFSEAIADPKIQFLAFISMFFSFNLTFIDECLPLWAVTTKKEGGLAFTTAEVGGLLAATGLCLALFQMFLFARFSKSFGPSKAKALFWFGVYASLSVASVPLISTLTVRWTENNEHISAATKKWVVSCLVLSPLMIYRCASCCVFTVVGIIINGSVPMEVRGTMNGMILTVGSIGQAFGPILGSILYATLIDAPMPLQGQDVFIVGGLLFLAYGIVCRYFLSEPSK